MDQSNLAQDQSMPKRNLAILLTVVLWLLSIILTIVSIFAIREIVLLELAVLLPNEDTLSRLQASNVINLVHQCTLPILGVIGVVVMVICTEFLFNHAGKPRALRNLARIIAAESVIVLPVWLFLWRP